MTMEPRNPIVLTRTEPPRAVCVAVARRTRAVLADQVVPWVQRVGRPLAHHLAPVLVILLLLFAMGGTWQIARAAPARSPATASASSTTGASASTSTDAVTSGSERGGSRGPKKPASALTGKLNLNTASEEQLVMLPAIGPAKAERIVAWRKKNGGFRRIADLRRVKGFGYKTFKRLEPFLDITGDTTLR